MSPQQPSSKGPGRRYSTFVGIAFLVLVIVATLNTIRTQGGGTLGVDTNQRGIPLSEFAVPNALTGPLDFDANVYQDNCSTSEQPCPTDAQRQPACQINYPPSKAIRVCDLFNRPLVLSFWFTRGANCLPTQDALNAVSEKYKGRVNFLSIDVRDNPSDVRSIAQSHGWTMHVGYDRDGAVSDLYRVGGCPTVAFAYPGGILDFAKASIAALSKPATVSGNLQAGIERDVKTLLRQTRAREAESR